MFEDLHPNLAEGIKLVLLSRKQHLNHLNADEKPHLCCNAWWCGDGGKGSVSSGVPPGLQSISQDEGVERIINLLKFPIVLSFQVFLGYNLSQIQLYMTVTSNACYKIQVLGSTSFFFCGFFFICMVSSLPGLGHCSTPPWSWGSGIEAEHPEHRARQWLQHHPYERARLLVG